MTDWSGVLCEANLNATDIFEIRRELLIGRPLALLVEGESRRMLYRWLLSRRGLEGALVHGERLRITRKKGLPIEVSATVTVVEGALRWFMQYQANAVLGHAYRHEQTFTDALFDAAQALIMEIGAEGRIYRT